MIFISHRGNLNGPDNNMENKIDSIKESLDMGFDVEIDFWYTDKGFFLGHDCPNESVDLGWLYERKNNLWVHAKNLNSITILKQTELNWFWHENDKITITSKGFIWCNLDVIVHESILVEPAFKKLPDTLLGVCTDFPQLYIK